MHVGNQKGHGLIRIDTDIYLSGQKGTKGIQLKIKSRECKIKEIDANSREQSFWYFFFLF